MAIFDYINAFDLKELKTHIQTAQPFPHFCIDNFLQEDFANEIHDSFPSYHEAKTMGREFSAVNEKYKTQVTDVSKFPAPILKLHELLASEPFLDMVSELTGIPKLLADASLSGGGMHETNSGGRLDVHVDFNFLQEKLWHRRVNILIYFNKDWKKEYGGNLDIWDKEVKNCGGIFEPIFNRACGFVTSDISYHGVTPVHCPPGMVRKSYAVYYYTECAPEGWNGEKHSTIFKARPDEWLKGNVLMPYEEKFRSSKNLLSSIKNSIFRIGDK